MIKKLLLTVFILACGLALHAQDKTVTGTVTDQDGLPLPGASVYVKGNTSIGAITGVDGTFSLQVPNDATIVISAVGFDAQEFSAATQTTFNVSLAETALTEVVVTANAIEKERKEIGYAINTVSADDLTEVRSPNALNSLAGRVPGVQITSASGSLGGSTNVLIRGTSSIGGNSQPLFVVDGVPIDNTNFSGAVDRFSAPDFGNRAADLNADDIESMTVLKGPAAAVLYGSRAANGAIIITTKRGKLNTKASVSISSSVRFEDPLRLPDYQNTFGQGSIGKLDSSARASWGPLMSPERTFTNANGQTETFSSQPDNVEDFFETGVTLINNVALSGGTENTSYRLSYTNTQQEGIVPNSELTKQVFNVNASSKLSERLSSSFGITYTRQDNTGRPIQGFNDPDVIVDNVYLFPRNTNLDVISDFKDPVTGEQIPFLGAEQNPYWTVNENLYTMELDRFTGNGQLGYQPLEWLNVSWRVGIDTYREQRQQITSPGSVGVPLGRFWQDRLYSRQVNSDLIATVTLPITQDIGFTGIVGHNVNDRYFESFYNESQDLADPTLFNVANANVNTPQETEERIRLYGVYFDLGFSFRDYLFVNLTGRNDWNSTLPEENRSFFYPSVSSSFIFTEAFGLDNNILTFGKLRANIAQVGNGTDPYLLNFRFFPQSDIFQLFGVDNAYPWGPNSIVGFDATGNIPADNTLVPEITTSWEVGADLQFFGGRLNVDATYYSARINDQILNQTIPFSTGFGSVTINSGDVRNRGVELLLSGQILRSNAPRGFVWGASVNFAQNNNELLNLNEGQEFATIPGTRTDPGLQARVGEPLGSIVGEGWRRNENGDIIINPTTGLREEVADTVIGNIQPDFRLGFQNTFSFKGFTLTALVDWSEGGQLHSQTIQALRAGGYAEETSIRDVAYIDNGVIDNGDGTFRPNDIPITYQQFWGQQDNTDEDGIFDATYVKLREVTLSYAFPQKWLENTFIGSLRVGVEGRNLALLFSNIPHIDPEVSFYGGGSNAQGIEAFNLPSTRSYGFNVRATF